MDAIVLCCGDAPTGGTAAALTERVGVIAQTVPARPGREVVDPVLAELAGRRLVVAGTDADLAAVVLRLLRTDRLAEVTVGFLAGSPGSVAARLWGLPTDPGAALDVALGGEPDPVPLIRDDVGGVLVGAGELGPTRGVGYCDDARVVRGPVRRVRVVADPAGAGLAVTITHRGLLRNHRRTAHGRSFEIGCLPATVVRDGVPHDRRVTRWTWYRHVQDLRVVRGLPG